MKSFKKQRLLSIILLLSVSVFTSQPICYAEQETSSFFESIKDILKKIDFTTSIKTEYDSNIFLSEADENFDIINTLTQKISLELPQDPFYIELDYTASLSYYTEEADNIHSHIAKFVFSYRPFDKFSFGISNYFRKMATKKITTVFGDRLLSRGYKDDTPTFELKLEPMEKLNIDVEWQHYYLAADSSVDNYIDRGDNTSKITFNYEFWPELSTFVGYKYQDAHFPDLSTKDSEFSRVFFGFTKKFPGIFNLTTEVGQEHNTLPVRDDGNTDLNLNLASTFSAYTIFNIILNYNSMVPSARSEYFQYRSHSAYIGITHLINPKTSVLASISLENQIFDSDDTLSGYTPTKRETDIISFASTLRRKLNDWLRFEIGYSYTKRNTDFAAEGYTDSKVSLGLTANY